MGEASHPVSVVNAVYPVLVESIAAASEDVERNGRYTESEGGVLIMDQTQCELGKKM